MNDRQLLELAAKAAGRIDWDHAPHIKSDEGDTRPWWNPLTDDGDALRLAVKLDLSSVMVFAGDYSGKRRDFWTPNSGHDGGRGEATYAEYAADPYAATRRAIVRAAAEIGRAA